MSHSVRRALAYALVIGFTVAGCVGSEQVAEPAAEQHAAPQDTVAQQPAPQPDRTEEAELPLQPIGGVNLDTVSAGRFVRGKMWTFEHPPVDYWQEEYGFEASPSWLDRARLGALRFGESCSASFVSPHGLIATNHHCGRESVVKVTEEGENLLENGFYARTVEDERRVPDLYVEQLVAIEDVTERVESQLPEGLSPMKMSARREQVVSKVQKQMNQELEDENERVEVVGLYQGARFSAYTYRRYNDVRLVSAAELALGYYGGDPDNFTYPRYALDFSFFRAYDENGDPVQTQHHFQWSREGASNGDPVFVVGNPGSSSRLQTVSQLIFRRDYQEPIIVDLLGSRVEALKEFRQNHPGEARATDLENTIFSLENAHKAYTGRAEGLRDPVLLAKRRDAQKDFKTAISADSSLQARFGGLLDRISELQDQKRQYAHLFGAFAGMNEGSDLASGVMFRAVMGGLYVHQRQMGARKAQLKALRSAALGVSVKHPELEKNLVEQRFQDFQRYLGRDHSIVQNVLDGRTPAQAAEELVSTTALMDSARFAKVLDKGEMPTEDLGLAAGASIIKTFLQFQQQWGGISRKENALNTRVGQARYAVYGTSIPPDATFTLRIADGVVDGYPYNGTEAPPFTTYYGLFDHNYSYPGTDNPWNLPEQWINRPDAFDMTTPLNLVSTNDIIGGNSGSPLLNQDLEVVGLIFDGNIESLPNEFIYVHDRPRAVSVDSRGILEALDDIYDADRIVAELLQGHLIRSEKAADKFEKNYER